MESTSPFQQAIYHELASMQKKNRGKLNKELVEELVLKRCWLARYWGLAAVLGLHVDIAQQRHAAWETFTLDPAEIVISAGHQVKLILARGGFYDCDVASAKGTQSLGSSSKGGTDLDLLAKEDESIKSQKLALEDGLRELEKLKVEEAVRVKISQNDDPTLIWLGLSTEEAQDIRFKQAWLVYFWRRAQTSKTVEKDIAMERLLYWINQTNRAPSYNDSVDVERGMLELRKLEIERQLKEPQGYLLVSDVQ